METTVGAIFEQGERSIKVPIPVYIRASASVAGTKEGQGPFGDCFDVVGKDDKFGCETWEEAESTLQKEALTLAIGKSGLKNEEIKYLFAGAMQAPIFIESFKPKSTIFPMVSPEIIALSVSLFTLLKMNAPLPVTVHVAERGRWFPYPKGNRNSFSALAKWLDVTHAACSAIPPAIITVAIVIESPQVEHAPYIPINGI